MLEQECGLGRRHAMYATEQRTPLFTYLKANYPYVTGSEFLGGDLPFGSTTATGIRNENMTGLTFASDSFDAVLSFDVLEHVPDYPRALAEVYRVLRPGGSFLFSVPFNPGSTRTIVRARVRDDGSIEHQLEPEYHGDPLSADGILCFQNFGWDLLERARDAGFAHADALFYWSEPLGYLGVEQVMFLARKG
jgi:SAM-dependent methyltransferase